MSEVSEATPPVMVVKKERTPAQLQTLRLAREKAAKVRTQNAEMRRKQAEIDKVAADAVKKQKVEQLEKEYAAIQSKTEPPPPEESTNEEEEVEYVHQKKPHKKKRIVVVEKSDSEEEIEIALPKERKPPPPDPKKQRYDKMYSKMFDL